ncbi:hypothetical protein HDU76_002072, partial [Blyttiomyces sp. JEL0837]
MFKAISSFWGGNNDEKQGSNNATTVFVQKISGDELIPVDLPAVVGDQHQRYDLAAFKIIVAPKLNLTPTSITIYEAHGSRLIESNKDFQDAVEHGYRLNTTTVFLCDGVVDPKEEDLKPMVAKTHPKVHSVKVDHVKSSQRIRMDIDDSWTLETFKDEIAKEMELDAATMTLFYMDGDFRVKVLGDQSFRTALKETESFLVEGSMLVNDEVASVVRAPSALPIRQKFIIKVTYESIVYVIEIQTALLDEFNDE